MMFPAALALGLAALSGCLPVLHTQTGGIGRAPCDAAVMPSGLAHVSAGLARALDEAPDEVFRILRPPAQPEVEVEKGPREPESPPATGRTKFGLRGGMLSSGGADVQWADAPQYGFYLRRVPFEPRRATYELAANYAATERPDEFRSSALFTLHGDLLLGKVGGSGVSVYLLVGAGAVIEDSTNTGSGKTTLGVRGGAEAGLGIGSASGAWELRGLYTQVLDTDNANSLISVSLGIAF
jgi:hypothetical protein